jgi:hypothetical protein
MSRDSKTLGIHSAHLSLSVNFSALPTQLCCVNNTISCRRRPEQPKLSQPQTRSIANASSQEPAQSQIDMLRLYSKRSIPIPVLSA